jgi:hypothetical protein
MRFVHLAIALGSEIYRAHRIAVARPRSHPSRPTLVFGAVLSVLLCDARAMAEQPEPRTYKHVDTYSIGQGYVPIGEWIEVKGHAWFTEQGGRFNLTWASAAYPISVDVSRLETELVRRLSAECPSIRGSLLGGGCEVVMRGQIGMVGDRHGIVATEVEIRAKGAR